MLRTPRSAVFCCDNTGKMLSIKIVSVDYYLSYPVSNLDTNYSEYRGAAVKSVPVIRIFGITQNKKKIAANVHEVFPYLYIPCSETNPDNIQKTSYQIAISLDKSINISLGQTTSTTQHVFKVSLVKGIPFYGYHKNDHQFFKIQMYNPSFVKRAANLFQNGVILGKTIQPHESHIPYILKFMIDYNLFGMSYLHVPMQYVTTRELDDKTLRKRAVSELEVDFKAIYILNRLVIANHDDSKAANPGIESIWEEERTRRSTMDPETTPSMDTPYSQSRIIHPTESDVYFRNKLSEKLLIKNNESLSLTMLAVDSSNIDSSHSGNIERKKTFNLKNLLDSSNYAAEFSQNSFSLTPSAEQNTQKSPELNDEDGNVSQSVEDLENMILNFTQSLNENDDDDEEVLEVMRLLEEENKHSEEDSVLAPISQSFVDKTLPPTVRQQPYDRFSDDSDDELFNNLNETVADLEIFSQYQEYSKEDENIPQLDGIDDELESQNQALSSSPSDISRQYDLKNNFTVKAGPSRIFISPQHNPVKLENPSPSGVSILNNTAIQSNLIKMVSSMANHMDVDKKETIDTEHTDGSSDDEFVKSYYNQTMIDDFESSVDENSNDFELCAVSYKVESLKCVIKPQLDPPILVLEDLHENNIPEVVNQIPFYGNPKDVTDKKEVGHVILELHGNKLNDLEEFHGLISQSNSIYSYRVAHLKSDLGLADDLLKHSSYVRHFLSTEKPVTICPNEDPPNYLNAKSWLRTGCDKDVNFKNADLESPIKIRREKILMTLKENPDEEMDVINETLNSSVVTPPKTSSKIVRMSSVENKLSTPLSSYSANEPYTPMTYSARRKRNAMKKSFSKKFQDIIKNRIQMEVESSSQSSVGETLENVSSVEEIKINSQSSDKSSEQTLSLTSSIQNANFMGDISFSNSCDITGPQLNNTYGFKMKLEKLAVGAEHNDLTVLSMELHVQTRNELKPDPDFDAISAIFYCVDGHYVSEDKVVSSRGLVTYLNDIKVKHIKHGVDVTLVNSESEVLEVLLLKIREWDPDILAGYEIEMNSWGYLIHRGYILNLNLLNYLSRVPMDKVVKHKDSKMNAEDYEMGDMGDYYSEVKIPGRILLDVWRLMKSEIALTSYTFENIAYHVLHRRYQKHSFSHLTTMWMDPMKLWIVLDYFIDRVTTTIELLKQLDLIGRTCELAKLFGIQFYEVLSRGSQFRVESMMIRIAKRRNYVAVSPSVQQRAHMRAPEYIPLILEPKSRFYEDPVIVLDFQSLYPTIIIAYNYCFSTCLGRVEYLEKNSSQPFEFGAYQLRVSPQKLKYYLDNDLVNISPCGVAYVKSSVREGVLPRMLREILDTRLMVKQSMKIHKNNTALQRVLHSRQLGLKLIANVTYGYTAANFSGRMPCIEVGDSVVSKGRETLERAIKMVESNDKWGCKVCYGDTDSLFVLVPGRSRQEAFKIGTEIVQTVSDENPHPVKLKLEKVYQPCILQTKKRYVGYMYETAEQSEPIYEAKGIETVRRDGCPAAAKILEKTLRILFETQDVSKVKDYVCRQFTKLLTGRCNIQDLIFAKEFRGINGYKERACVPALVLTRKWKLLDPRNEPRRGERVPFLIVNGAPGLPLIRLVRSPLDVLTDDSYKINSIYYITKVIIPPLNRCLLLIGANAHEWFAELPRKQNFIPLLTNAAISFGKKKGTISQYFSTTNCATDCGNQCHKGLCSNCRTEPQKTTAILYEKIMNLDRKIHTIQSICQSCCRRSFDVDCISLDCPVLYVSNKVKREFCQTEFYREILEEFF